MELPEALDPKVARIVRGWEPVALALAGLLAVTMIATWPLRFPDDTVIAGGWLGMPIETAISILLSTAGLASHRLRRPGSAGRVAEAGIFVVIATSGTVFVLGWFGVAFPVGVVSAPQTALALLLLSICICRCGTRFDRPSVDAALLLLLGAILLFMVGGHLFEATSIISSADGRLASPASILGIGLLASVVTGRMVQPGGPLAILGQRGAGSHMIRLMLPVTILAPFGIFALVVWLSESGTLDITVASALVAPALTIAVFALMSWMGRRINRLEDGLRRDSLTDRLTRVFNRAGLEAFSDYLMASAARTRTEILVLYFDLDELKQVNDTLGHDVGSRLISRFATLLVETFRDNDFVARVGGDEFVVLANGNDLDPLAMITRLETEAESVNRTTSEPYRIRFSAGFSFVHGLDDRGIPEAMTRADASMYQAKRERKEGVPGTQALRAIADRMGAGIARAAASDGPDLPPLARTG